MKGVRLFRQQLTCQLHDGLQAACLKALENAKAYAPYGDGRDGGHLRDCITGRVYSADGILSGELAAQNPHALYVEAGTSRMAAQPYLRPALSDLKQYFLHHMRT